MKKVFISLVLLLATSARAGLLVPDGIQDSRQLEQFFYSIESKLPPAMYQALSKTNWDGHIKVQFQDIPKQGDTILAPNCNDVVDSMTKSKNAITEFYNAQNLELNAKAIRYNEQIQSFVSSRNEIILHKDFLRIIRTENPNNIQFNCDHKNLYQLAMANVVHQLAVIYDKPAYSDQRPDSIANRRSPVENQYLYPGRVSGKLKYRFLADARKDNLNNDGFWPRALNPFEYAGDISDNFAYNMEYFILDPEYACRKPLQNDYFSKLFANNNVPFDSYAQTRTCQVNTKLKMPHNITKRIMDKNGLMKELTTVVYATYDLNPDYVYNVDYFLAGVGAGSGSAGHSMFRIISCAPGTPLSENCQKTEGNYDLIINPRANPLEMQLDNMKGFFGGYPSMFLMTPMDEIYKEYELGELRNIYNIPLTGYHTKDGLGNEVNIMDPELKKRFIWATLDQYWDYYGNYKFLTNNCADETMRLYQMSSENEDILNSTVLKPFDVSDELTKYSLADNSQANTQEQNKSIFATIFSFIKKPDYKWDDFEKLCETYKQANETLVSRKCALYESLRDILIRENTPLNQIDTTKKLEALTEKWIDLAKPSVQIAKNADDKRNCMQEIPQTNQDAVLKDTFDKIKFQYDNLMAKTKDPSEQMMIIKDFFNVMYYIEEQRTEAIGNSAVEIAYKVAYNKKSDSKDAPDIPAGLDLKPEEVQLIKNAVDNYTNIEMAMMPYMSQSVLPGYGIPLENEVVRGQAYFDAFKKEDQASKDVIESTKCLLGYEYVVYKNVQSFLTELRFKASTM